MTFTTGVQWMQHTLKLSAVVVLWLLSLFIATSVQAQTDASAPASDSTPAATQTESYAALADILENNKTRDQLVEQLRQLATQPEAAPEAAADAQDSPPAAEQRSVQD